MLLAAQNGHVDVMQSLLQHRATVDLKKTVSAKIKYTLLIITVINFEFSLKKFRLNIIILNKLIS